MPSNSDKWIRSIKDNPAGKVVADPDGNRWEWQSTEETGRLLRKLDNSELEIEATNVRPAGKLGAAAKGARDARRPAARPLTPGGRDAAGGFNPYDHSGKPKRR
jgi:hypothetical protein